MVQATSQEERGLTVVCVQIGLSNLCTVHLWLSLESMPADFAVIMSQRVYSRLEVRDTQRVSVYKGIMSAFASRTRGY